MHLKNLFYLFFAFTCLHANAQNLTPEEAFTRSSKYPQERIYVAFDKPDYLAGETMHFKAYVFTRFRLSRISTNLYFEYLDRNKKVIYKSLIPVYTGIAEGSFTIPKHLSEDVYYFRAFTSWMLNFDEKFQLVKPINIYNPSSATKITEVSAEWYATVHPEGGSLVDNIESKAAIRLQTGGTLPKSWSGYLYENNDPSKKIADVKMLNEEIGSVSLTPAFGKNYSIKITDDKQKSKVIALPAILQQGITVSLTSTPGSIKYTLKAKGINEPFKGYKITADNQGEIIYSAIIKNSANPVTSSIIADSLTQGVVHVTLFDAAGNLVSERFCFVPPPVLNKIPHVQLVQRSRQQKGLNRWTINTDTLNNYTYTVKVTDGNTEDDSHNFLKTYWLGEAISLPVKANGYFNPAGAGAVALDHLLMTESRGQEYWKNFLNKPVPILNFAPDNFLSYEGTALQNKKLLPMKKIGIVIQASDSAKAFLSVNTDNMGNFTIRNIEFRDTAKVFYRLNSLQESQNNIDVIFRRLDDSRPYTGLLPVSSFTSSPRKPGDSIPQRIKDYVVTLNNSALDDDRYKQLEGVTIQAKAKDVTKELNKTLSSPIFTEPGEIIFDFINKYTDEAGSGIVEWLEGKVPGYSIEGGVAYMRNSPMGLYINEFAADYTQLSSYAVTDIALVKVLRNAFALGSSAPVLVIYTKTGNSFKVDPAARIKNTRITGYPKLDKFKIADYSDEKYIPKNDLRSVLYWNTTWIPQSDTQEIRFYNNDLAKKFRLVIMGFSKDGIPVFLEKEIVPE